MKITRQDILTSIKASKALLADDVAQLANIAGNLYNGDISLVTANDTHQLICNLQMSIADDIAVLDTYYS